MDDLELLQVRIFSVFHMISLICEATMAKRMKIDLYCQQRNYCSPLSVLFQRCIDYASIVRHSSTRWSTVKIQLAKNGDFQPIYIYIYIYMR